MRVLILGGTGEARALAAALDERPGVEVTSSLAGRVSNPALPAGAVRIGGFGGAAGLAEYLRCAAVHVLVDATHPFAATITRNAVAAAAAAGCPLLLLQRPGWTAGPGDAWTRVADTGSAAAHVAAAPPGCVFVTTGRRDLAAYAADPTHDYLVRAVEPPDGATPARMTLVLDRGPYTLDGELALLRRYGVRLVVTKDSGGAMTAAKLAAARQCSIPVVMVDRPPLPTGIAALDSVGAALSRLGNGAG